MINYHLIEADGRASVVAFNPSDERPLYQADSSHPHWASILQGLQSDDESVFELFDVRGGLIVKLTRLSDRISFDGDNILFDGDAQSGPLAEHLLRCLKAGTTDWQPIVNFWEKLAQNPDVSSREQLFNWLKANEFSVSENGDIIGYKGVTLNADGHYVSVNSGTAWVDGREIIGKIPNNIGSVVTMPRSSVKNDPHTACAQGLHVGAWSYAVSFGDREHTLEVHVNPRDVVSMPNDEAAQKIRCCRYTVIGRVQEKHHEPIVGATVNRDVAAR